MRASSSSAPPCADWNSQYRLTGLVSGPERVVQLGQPPRVVQMTREQRGPAERMPVRVGVPALVQPPDGRAIAVRGGADRLVQVERPPGACRLAALPVSWPDAQGPDRWLRSSSETQHPVVAPVVDEQGERGEGDCGRDHGRYHPPGQRAGQYPGRVAEQGGGRLGDRGGWRTEADSTLVDRRRLAPRGAARPTGSASPESPPWPAPPARAGSAWPASAGSARRPGSRRTGPCPPTYSRASNGAPTNIPRATGTRNPEKQDPVESRPARSWHGTGSDRVGTQRPERVGDVLRP